MTVAIDTVDGRDLSNKVHHELVPKKTKVMCFNSCLLLISQSSFICFATRLTPTFITEALHLTI